MPKTAVIKVGGDVLLSEPQWRGLAENIQYIHRAGWQCVILHGGGPQVNSLQEQIGLTPNKVAGRRITSERDLVCVMQAIAGQVNVELCNRLQQWHLPVIGTHGASGLISATKRPPMLVSGIEKPVDFGLVGDVDAINTEQLLALLSAGLIPVIATLARDEQANIYNINADTTVVAIARALQADILCMVTAVGGIYRDIEDPESLITTINAEIAEQMIADNIITDGMIAKVQEALGVVADGVGQVVITSMAKQDNLLNLIQSPDNYCSGTRILHS